MLHRPLVLCALASLAVLGACGDDTDNAIITIPGNTTTVRFINATGNPITVTQNGTVVTGNSAIAFGNGSSCLAVDPANPNLVFTNTTTGATITGFTPHLTAGGNVTVVAFTDANGNTQFATLDNTFAPVNGQAGLRVFNAANGSGNVVVLSNGVVLNNGATTTFSNGGTFFSIPAGTQALTFNTGTGTTTIGSLGANLVAGSNNTIVLAPAAPGTTALRVFLSTGC